MWSWIREEKYEREKEKKKMSCWEKRCDSHTRTQRRRGGEEGGEEGWREGREATKYLEGRRIICAEVEATSWLLSERAARSVSLRVSSCWSGTRPCGFTGSCSDSSSFLIPVSFFCHQVLNACRYQPRYVCVMAQVCAASITSLKWFPSLYFRGIEDNAAFNRLVLL